MSKRNLQEDRADFLGFRLGQWSVGSAAGTVLHERPGCLRTCRSLAVILCPGAWTIPPSPLRGAKHGMWQQDVAGTEILAMIRLGLIKYAGLRSDVGAWRCVHSCCC